MRNYIIMHLIRAQVQEKKLTYSDITMMCFCFEKMSILHLHPPVFKSGNKVAFSLYGITSFF